MKTVIDTGNYIAARAALMAKPKVVAAYPITPQTTIVEGIAKYVENGELDAEYICVESEHSAMSACIGAAATGVRTFTATSAHGLLLMHEMLHWAALARLPIVMCNVNRAIGPGWNIWCDENDSIAQRDTGWLQFYCSSNQEVFDTVIQAYKIAENEKVLLPAMVNLGGFILSHTSLPVKVPEQKEIDEFLPPYKPKWRLDVNNPITHGNIIFPDDYYRIRYDMQLAQNNSKKIIKEVAKEWKEKFGTYHGDLVEVYKCDNADLVILAMGAIGAEAKVAVDKMQREGLKVGLLRIRVLRPFPDEEIIKIAKQCNKLLVIDRNISVGNEGALASETRACLKDRVEDANVHGFIAGLGGKDVTYNDIEKMCKMVINKKAGRIEWYGLG